MHLTGKIFAFLTLCLAVGAVIMTAKVLDKQNEWNEKIEKSRSSYEKVIVEVPVAKAKLSQLKNDLSIQRLDWGRHWDNVETLINNEARGILSIHIGKNQNLVRVTDAGEVYPTLYAFQPAANGMVFVGAFRVTQMENNRSGIQLNRPPLPGETKNWKPGKWRFRDGLPAAKEGEVGDLLIDLVVLEQSIKNRMLNLSIQQKSVKNAQSLLNQRLKELNGDANLPAEVNAVYRDGLVETLRAAQEKRDESLAEVQRLRQQLHDLYTKFEGLLAENEMLEKQMQPATQTGQNPTSLNSKN